jgi:hypothetical protein
MVGDYLEPPMKGGRMIKDERVKGLMKFMASGTL